MLCGGLVVQQQAHEALCVRALAVEGGHSQLDGRRLHQPRHLGESSDLVA